MLKTDPNTNRLPEALGFRNGATSVHTSRTMMFDELSLVLANVRAEAPQDEYFSAIIDDNILGKPTQTTRQTTAQRLAELYTLDSAKPLFRVLRQLWNADKQSRPMLAFLVAAARDPILRETTPYVQEFPVGEVVTADAIAAFLTQHYPNRFKQSTATATAQRLASSWTQAGYLRGRTKKSRAKVAATPVSAMFALLLGYLCGYRGNMLMDSIWCRFLDETRSELAALVLEASRQGWLTYKGVGNVVEVTFRGLLTPSEERATHEPG